MRIAWASIALLCSTLPSVVLATSPDLARTFRVDCDARRQTIGAALRRAHDGDTIVVRGRCRESLVIDKGVVLEGGGRASIAPADPAENTLDITARNVTIRGFSLEAPAFFQIFVQNGATVLVESNTIRNAARFGVSVASNAVATLTDNELSDNQLGGMIGLTGAQLVVGVRSVFEPPLPNTFRGTANTGIGIVVVGGAGATILGGNLITGHNLGILVQDASNARIAGNLIDGNRIGVLVDHGGSVELPTVGNAVAAFNELNSGVNLQFGIACKGGNVVGVLDGLRPGVRLPPAPGVLGGPLDGLPTHCLDQTQTLVPPGSPN